MAICRKPSGVSTLTVRQLRILEMVCEGKLYKEIAYDLGLKNRQAIGHSMRHIKRKFRARSLGHTVALYCRLKMSLETAVKQAN